MAEKFEWNQEFPDLEGLFSLSLGYKNLQGVLRFIFEALKKQEKGIKYLYERDKL